MPKQPFQGGVVALDQGVAPHSIGMPDTVKVRIVSVIDLTDDASIYLRLACTDHNRSMSRLYRPTNAQFGQWVDPWPWPDDPKCPSVSLSNISIDDAKSRDRGKRQDL